jgi:hypothetical protein
LRLRSANASLGQDDSERVANRPDLELDHRERRPDVIT